MRIIFVSFTDANESREMHTKSIETEDVINELFNTFRKRYQEGLETKMSVSSFTLLYPYTTEKKLRKHERICNDRDFRHLKMYV